MHSQYTCSKLNYNFGGQVGIIVKNNPGSNSDIDNKSYHNFAPLCTCSAFGRSDVHNKWHIVHKIGFNHKQKVFTYLSGWDPELANCFCGLY